MSIERFQFFVFFQYYMVIVFGVICMLSFFNIFYNTVIFDQHYITIKCTFYTYASGKSKSVEWLIIETSVIPYVNCSQNYSFSSIAVEVETILVV